MDYYTSSRGLDFYQSVYTDEDMYVSTPEYQQYGRPYSTVFGLLTSEYRTIDISNFREELTDEKMDGYYYARLERLTEDVNELNLSEGTKAKLIENARSVETP